MQIFEQVFSVLKNVLGGKVSACFVLLFLSTPVFADHMRNGRAVGSGWAWAFTMESIQLEDEAADREGVGDDTYAFGVKAEYLLSDFYSVNLGGSFVLFEDTYEFTQFVRGRYGDVNYRESDVTGLQLYVDAGPIFFVDRDGRFAVSPRFGVSNISLTERSISDCFDCYEENVNIDTGAYGALNLKYDFGSFVGELSLIKQVESDQDSAIRIGFQSHF